MAIRWTNIAALPGMGDKQLYQFGFTDQHQPQREGVVRRGLLAAKANRHLREAVTGIDMAEVVQRFTAGLHRQTAIAVAAQGAQQVGFRGLRVAKQRDAGGLGASLLTRFLLGIECPQSNQQRVGVIIQ